MCIRRFIYIIFPFLLCGSHSEAQTEFGETPRSRIFFGGDFRLAVTSFGSILDLNPFAGYNLNQYISVSAGPSYIFYSERTPGMSQSYRTSFYGGRTFIRIRPFPERLPSIYFQGETQLINSILYSYNSNFEIVKDRVWNPYVLGGIGFRQQASENAFFTFTLLFNFLKEDGSEYSYLNGNPLSYRVGFIIGMF